MDANDEFYIVCVWKTFNNTFRKNKPSICVSHFSFGHDGRYCNIVTVSHWSDNIVSGEHFTFNIWCNLNEGREGYSGTDSFPVLHGK